MSKNLVIGTKTYEGVSTVNFNTASGGIAVFKDTDEITSGSSYDISTELVEFARNDTEADIASKDFWATKTLQLPFKAGIVVFHVDCDVAPTQGMYTMQNMFFFVDGVSVTTAVTGNSILAAPNSIENSKGLTAPGTGTAVFNANTKVLQFYSGFGDGNVYIPAGAIVKVGFIPFNYDTALIPAAE